MKALSLKQPYVELILEGKKKIELRKWNTHFRGEFLLHASKNVDNEAIKRFGFAAMNLPTGVIAGKATIRDVKHYANEGEHIKDKHLHLANSYWGNYGFVLDNVSRIEPISSKGKLGFWDFNGSAEHLQAKV